MRMLIACAVAVALVLPVRASAGGTPVAGIWKLLPEKSTDIASWKGRALVVRISQSNGALLVVHGWLERGRVAYADSFLVRPGGKAARSVVRSVIWPDNWFMGVLASVGDTRTVKGFWRKAGTSLRVETVEPVVTSQGKTSITTTRDYVLGSDGGTLTVTEQRSTRPAPVVLRLAREEAAP